MNMSLGKLTISEDIKLQILKDYVEPSYINDVNDLLSSRKCYRITGQVFETTSKILVAGAGILSFSSGYFNNPTLSFIAGAVSTISLACLQFSAFVFKESTDQTKELNKILEKLNIETVPVFTSTTNYRQASSSSGPGSVYGPVSMYNPYPMVQAHAQAPMQGPPMQGPISPQGRRGAFMRRPSPIRVSTPIPYQHAHIQDEQLQEHLREEGLQLQQPVRERSASPVQQPRPKTPEQRSRPPTPVQEMSKEESMKRLQAALEGNPIEDDKEEKGKGKEKEIEIEEIVVEPTTPAQPTTPVQSPTPGVLQVLKKSKRGAFGGIL
jgi:hypothetical protein